MTLVFAAVLLFAPLRATPLAQLQTDQPPYPPPGKLVDVGGWKLHLNCTGESRALQPTVILEAGAGDFSVEWSLVQPAVAKFARVCSYDRAGDGWSAPIFIQLAKGSWGFQAGAEQVDVVLLIMNESGVQKLLENKINLGADASVAAGPMGRQGQIGTDAKFSAEILSYSRAKGLFAGIDLSGGMLRPDEDANRKVYGTSATPRTILASREISAPTEAAPFLNALGRATSTTAAPSSPSAPSSTTSSSPATTSERATTSQAGTTAQPAATSTINDGDVRARIADIQRTLDRLLADTGKAPVGTTGTTQSEGTVTVDRATLQQLRQQLDALSAALDQKR